MSQVLPMFEHVLCVYLPLYIYKKTTFPELSPSLFFHFICLFITAQHRNRERRRFSWPLCLPHDLVDGAI